VQADNRDIKLVKLFLKKYNDDHGYNYAITESPEEVERNKQAVEAIARDQKGNTLAIELTLAQPHVGDKVDTQPFLTIFEPLEKDTTMAVPEYDITLSVPVGAVPKGVNWKDIGVKLQDWFRNERTSLPLGDSKHKIANLEIELSVTVEKTYCPGFIGKVFVCRSEIPSTFSEVIRVALSKKLPKLVATQVGTRILLLEKDSPPHGYAAIARAIKDAGSDFPALAKVEQVWIANTVAWESENVVWFVPVWPESLRRYKIN
jgi:hypothetical protein